SAHTHSHKPTHLFLIILRPPRSTLFPYTTLFRSARSTSRTAATSPWPPQALTRTSRAYSRPATSSTITTDRRSLPRAPAVQRPSTPSAISQKRLPRSRLKQPSRPELSSRSTHPNPLWRRIEQDQRHQRRHLRRRCAASIRARPRGVLGPVVRPLPSGCADPGRDRGRDRPPHHHEAQRGREPADRRALRSVVDPHDEPVRQRRGRAHDRRGTAEEVDPVRSRRIREVDARRLPSRPMV